MMKAAVLESFSQPLVITEVPEPEPADDEVVVEVRAVGLCGTDLKIVSGALGNTPLPLIPGHEVAGVVMADAGPFERGQRVACYIYNPCGSCRWCHAGQETLCPFSRRIGFERDGGLARYICMKQRNVLPFGNELSFDAAAVCMDAVTSPWRALVVRAALQAGELLVIAGAGGLGLNGLQIARSLGARVAVIDPVESHRAAALELGAELAVDPAEGGQIRDWAEGGADVGLETSGVRAGFDGAAACLRDGGRIVCCGYKPGLEYGLDSSHLVLREISVLGSRAGTRDDTRAALEAVERGAVRPLVTEYMPLDAINDALQRLRSQEVLGRIVIQP